VPVCIDPFEHRGRDEVSGILGKRIKLQPDESGRFLWAEYLLELAPLLPIGSNANLMVAGAGFGICLLRVPRAALPHNSPAATALAAAWRGQSTL
jgi:hypothetical protein